MIVLILLLAVCNTSCVRRESDSGSPATPQPLLVLPEKSIDVGRVESGTKVHRQFEVRNDGDAVLVVSKISASCGCTQTKTKSLNVGPGECGTVEVLMDTSGRAGQVRGSLVLESNDPANPRSLVELRADVTKLLTLDPTTLAFDNLSAGRPVQQTVGVRIEKPCRLTARAEGFAAPDVKVTVDVEQEAPTSAKLLVTATAERAGDYFGNIVLTADHRESDGIDEARVPLTVRSEGPVTAGPRQLWFHPSEEPYRPKDVEIRHREGIHDLELEAIEFDAKVLDVGRAPDETGKIRLHVAPAKGAFDRGGLQRAELAAQVRCGADLHRVSVNVFLLNRVGK